MDNLEYVSLEALVPDAVNARKHGERNLEEVVRSLREFGQHAPLVVQRSTGRVLVGNGRLEAMRRLGWAEAWVFYVDDDNVTAVRRALADNRTAELAEWDEGILRGLLDSVGGLEADVPGFSMEDLDRILADAESERERTNPDDVPLVPEDPVSIPGDLWILGKHRLVCGDSTDRETVARLLGGAAPQLMVTDPPYGVEYDPTWRHRAGVNRSRRIGRVENDDRSDWREAWTLFPGDVAYVWHGALRAVSVAQSLEACGFTLRAQIIWAKERLVLGRGDYHWQHEPCWYAVRRKGHWAGGRAQTTLWPISSRDQDEDTVHGTQKPVECMKRPIENNSNPGQGVYDPFLGSGTTVIAAEMTGRVCFGCELNPAYADVVVERWQRFSGQEARLEASGATFAEEAEERRKRRGGKGGDGP